MVHQDEERPATPQAPPSEGGDTGGVGPAAGCPGWLAHPLETVLAEHPPKRCLRSRSGRSKTSTPLGWEGFGPRTWRCDPRSSGGRRVLGAHPSVGRKDRWLRPRLSQPDDKNGGI